MSINKGALIDPQLVERLRRNEEVRARKLHEMGIRRSDLMYRPRNQAALAYQADEARLAEWRETQKRVRAELGIGRQIAARTG